ncbi:hypothetical protein PVK06_012120 [Gossypium arboreum]|uniref:Putative plant transposon protein domain-containing protein n=1 Tax=Gossypium arboreum TaxID=29729 RepID=A0ABR0QAR5_GOSAR|nr:hypothetical protein PVK06_012120 [Gossypium arboreum]
MPKNIFLIYKEKLLFKKGGSSHRWEQFCVTPKENTTILVVQEFYASFRDQDMRRLYDEIWKTVAVKGKEVQVTPQEICEFYNAPYYAKDFLDNIDLNTFRIIKKDDILKYLTQGRGLWNHRPNTELSTNFNQAITFPIAKMWMQLICTRIAPTLDAFHVNTF